MLTPSDRPLSDWEESDHNLRYARPHRPIKLRAAFYASLGDIPLDVPPGDYHTCRQIIRKLITARRECSPLTNSEHGRLSALICKWQRRASGQEIR